MAITSRVEVANADHKGRRARDTPRRGPLLMHNWARSRGRAPERRPPPGGWRASSERDRPLCALVYHVFEAVAQSEAENARLRPPSQVVVPALALM